MYKCAQEKHLTLNHKGVALRSPTHEQTETIAKVLAHPGGHLTFCKVRNNKYKCKTISIQDYLSKWVSVENGCLSLGYVRNAFLKQSSWAEPFKCLLRLALLTSSSGWKAMTLGRVMRHSRIPHKVPHVSHNSNLHHQRSEHFLWSEFFFFFTCVVWVVLINLDSPRWTWSECFVWSVIAFSN